MSTQVNLSVLCAELGAIGHALEHARKAMQRVQEQDAAGLPLPPERAAIVGTMLHNLGMQMQQLQSETLGLLSPVRVARQAWPLGTEHHPDLDWTTTRDGAANGSPHQSALRPDHEARWCHEQAARIVERFLGDDHPISPMIGAVGLSALDAAARGSRVDGHDRQPSPWSRQVGHDVGGPSPGMSSTRQLPVSYTSAGRLHDSAGAVRPLRLGKTLLGQRVDGATLGIGWPQFTLIEL